jgi:hypothetical protein
MSPEKMRRSRLAALVMLFATILTAPAAIAADPLDPTRLAPENDCRTWMPEAAEYHGVPAGLLEAIGMAESGKPGSPWPWTLNVGGKGYWLHDPADARALMHGADGELRDDVAVGCMQIFTRWHKQHFRDWAHMLTPRNNVYYAAWLLRRLYVKHGTWTDAVGHYHASTANTYDRRRYVCTVMQHQIRLGHGRLTDQALNYCTGRFAGYLDAESLMRTRTAAR